MEDFTITFTRNVEREGKTLFIRGKQYPVVLDGEHYIAEDEEGITRRIDPNKGADKQFLDM